MKKNDVDFTFRSPYYTLGSPTPNTRCLWIIFHGYGQLAEEFAKSFSILLTMENYLIFPQGLSKFYLKGIKDNIGANWMTSYDRDIDIKNYITYLDQVYEREIRHYEGMLELNILGFSQGGHTASRWINQSNIPYNKFILWGSTLASEIDTQMIKNSFSKGENLVVLGDQDKYISEDQLATIKKRYEKIGFSYNLHIYHGGHDITPEILTQIL